MGRKSQWLWSQTPPIPYAHPLHLNLSLPGGEPLQFCINVCAWSLAHEYVCLIFSLTNLHIHVATFVHQHVTHEPTVVGGWCLRTLT